MEWYRADLHVHTVLSPCGDLDMSPIRIVEEAKNKKLDIIGITDHNSTLHTEIVLDLASREGITVFSGVEISTVEEVHCLAFFEDIATTEKFQDFLDAHATSIKNVPAKFGMQLLVNEQEEVLGEIPDLLIMGISATINEVAKAVHALNGVFIPAHVDKSVNSIYSQIGFIPIDLKIDALEYSWRITEEALLLKRPELKDYTLISNSDAHLPEALGKRITEYYLHEPSFKEWKKALKGEGNRKLRVI